MAAAPELSALRAGTVLRPHSGTDGLTAHPSQPRSPISLLVGLWGHRGAGAAPTACSPPPGTPKHHACFHRDSSKDWRRGPRSPNGDPSATRKSGAKGKWGPEAMGELGTQGCGNWGAKAIGNQGSNAIGKTDLRPWGTGNPKCEKLGIRGRGETRIRSRGAMGT